MSLTGMLRTLFCSREASKRQPSVRRCSNGMYDVVNLRYEGAVFGHYLDPRVCDPAALARALLLHDGDLVYANTHDEVVEWMATASSLLRDAAVTLEQPTRTSGRLLKG